MPQRMRIECKDCGEPVFVTATAVALDLARNLSAPERCPKCRAKNRAQINAVGQSYWIPKLETDDSKRCWGKYGLGRLRRERAEPVVEEYEGIPVELPLLAARNPDDPRIPERWRELAKKFSKIAPIAEELVAKATAADAPRVFVLVGPTGTGKSTWVPYRLLRSPIGERGRIVVTQPRTITLRGDETGKGPPGVPGFIASTLMGLTGNRIGAGQEIGLQYSGVYDQKDAYTKLFFVTDGTLINMIRSGDIGQYDLVMIDEAHEQSRNMELIFALLKYRMPLYPRLKLLIASATIDVDKFAGYFGGGSLGGVCVVPADRRMAVAAGTLKTIHDRFISGSVDDVGRPASALDFGAPLPNVQRLVGQAARDRLSLLPAAVAEVVGAIVRRTGFTKLGLPRGDILVFLPRIEDVQNTANAVKGLGLPLRVFECHAQVESFHDYDRSDKAAARAMERGEPTDPQRVVLATNYAETSVTMSNLRYVIDSGLIVQQGWDPVTCSVSYGTGWHSQAGCKQRKGRVGRVQEGECFRLYTKAEHDAMPKDTPPEVSRVPLDTFLLEAKASGIEDLSTFEWLGKSAEAAAEVARASTVLSRRGVLDDDGDITHRGVEFAGFQVNTVDLALCMSESDAFACTLEVATFLAFLQAGGSLFKKGEAGALGYAQWRAGCTDDVELYLRVFHHWITHPDRNDRKKRSAWFGERGVNDEFLTDVAAAREGLVRVISRRTHDSVTWRALDLKRLHRVRLMIARCLPEWIYVKDPSTGAYLPNDPEKCPCKEPVRVDTESACLAATGLTAFVCVGRTRIGKAVVAQHLVRIDPRWIGRLRESPLALAMLLRESLAAEALIAASAASTIPTTPARPKPLTYRANQRLTLTVVKRVTADGEDGPDAYLCETAEKMPVIVDLGGRLPPGCTVQAVTVEAGTSTLVRVTQKPLIDELVRSGAAIGATVTGVATPSDGRASVYGLYVRVNDVGIEGLLHKQGMANGERPTLLALGAGQAVQVVVGGMTDRGLAFITPAVAEGRKVRFALRQRVNGTVVEKCTYATGDRAGRPSGLRLELVPGRTGFLPMRALGRFADRRYAATEVGESIAVEVSELSSSPQEDVSLVLCRPAFALGQRVPGVVSGLAKDTTGYGPPIAFLELFPGVIGVLHHRQAPRGFLKTLREGTAVVVWIASRRPDKNDEMQYDVRVT